MTIKIEKQIDTESTLKAAVQGLEDKKAKDIIVLDLRKLPNAVSDYFIVCHGTSDTQVKALADAVEETVRKQTKDKPWHIEGTSNAEWVLIDYVNVVVHIFLEHSREFYQLEDLWADAQITKIENSFN